MTLTAHPRPSTSIRPKALLLASATILAGLALSGCSALGIESTYDKSTGHEFATGAEGKEQQVLPAWVPDEATNIKEIVRTTGNERILRMDHAGALPPGCVAIAETGKPTMAELAEGLELEDPAPMQEIAGRVESQYQTPLLSADWWPTGQENLTTHLCGKWWVSRDDSSLTAYAPELKGIAENILAEQAKAQRAKVD
ncbi:YgdI/YgdR family lipoprotein [Paeniglutamicibacter sp. ABSL32-1]|uniref:YgdI/YgdR family lipoprotein n=1 Tax=Paeniglutamicibacter quisquiliarum TaxID=2849498 RepID=UPI001C2D8C2C|nr:YgdI/YgdR family lipoprotein [Paeniglutamicibacter quisquiliarum]MBV1780553.1 YgdI/YgdR family lipoprotein [Paeniglutamicibacter quisquiliarum]